MRYFVHVTQVIEVDIDESKFDEQFFKEFNETMYNFGSNLELHAKHLAQLYATGDVDGYCDFAEGYGRLKEMNVSFTHHDQWADIDEIYKD